MGTNKCFEGFQLGRLFTAANVSKHIRMFLLILCTEVKETAILNMHGQEKIPRMK